jgi:hypothetical protein
MSLRIGVLRDIKARLQEGVGKGEQGARLYLIGRGMGAKLHAASRYVRFGVLTVTTCFNPPPPFTFELRVWREKALTY